MNVNGEFSFLAELSLEGKNLFQKVNATMVHNCKQNIAS